jgi:hypothetical protein
MSRNVLDDLLAAAKDFPGVRVHESIWSPILAASALANSALCCDLHRGGHHKWSERSQKLHGQGLATCFGEINAESWKHQENDTPADLWAEAFRCWKQSRAHWFVAKEPHKLFGAAIAKSSQGIFYMTIVVADGGGPLETAAAIDYKLW